MRELLLIFCACGLALALLVLFGGASRLSGAQTNTIAGRASAPQPAVFALGVISVGNVYRGSFTPDGRGFYFFKNVTPGQEDYRIFVSHLRSGGWTQPEKVKLGGEYSDMYPAISRDGTHLVFSSYRLAPGATADRRMAHLWYAERKGDGWGEPVFMAAANTLGDYHSQTGFGHDGALYFWRTFRSATVGQTMLTLRTRWDGKQYGKPEPYEEVERGRNWKPELYVWGGAPGPDGAFVLLEVSKRHPQTNQPGPSDIWVSIRRNGNWAPPQPLGAGVNSEGNDNFIFYSSDGKELFFVRDFNQFYHISLQAALESVK
jgi:hypothetical protein